MGFQVNFIDDYHHLGHALVEGLRTDNKTDQHFNIITGTRIKTSLDKDNKIPNGVSKVIEVDN